MKYSRQNKCGLPQPLPNLTGKEKAFTEQLYEDASPSKAVMAEHEIKPAEEMRCLPQPLPKHTIFLSHSGKEKAFAEQLCEDLNRMNHYPFFDQDSDSLPKGEKFAHLIFSAAEQCLLAVVVLSEGYLSSKWPMLELSTFVKSMKGSNPSLKLFPQ